MTKFACRYTRLIGPCRDGVLAIAERGALREHLTQGCKVCVDQTHYLDWLSAQLRAQAIPVDELALQRKRLPLLVQATELRQRLQQGRQQRLGAMKGALAAAAAIGLGFLLIDRTPSVRVARVSGDGEIRRYTEGERSIVQLSDGRYELHVSRGMLDRSLGVRLPDGEIEDIGTAFAVTVQRGHTSRVAVSQGAVELRLSGSPHLTLGAGSVWEPAAAPSSAPVLESVEASAPAELPAHAADSGDAPVDASTTPHARSDKHLKPQHRRSNVGSAATPETKASTTEDAMYLRVLDLLRENRHEAARALARRYLQEFPSGFRREEVSGIADPR